MTLRSSMAEQAIIDGIYAPALDDRLVASEPLAYSRACFFVNRQGNKANKVNKIKIDNGVLIVWRI